jgi:hypothetical protein
MWEQGAAISSSQVSWLEQGISSYWGSWLASNNINISFNFEVPADEPGTCADPPDVTVFVDGNLSGSNTIAQASPTYGIGINPDFLADYSDNSNFWNWDGAHEMGHVLGFDHTSEDCAQTYSVMVPVHDDSFILPSGTACGDAGALTQFFLGSNQYDGDDYSSSTNYEDCWDHYVVTVEYWYDSDGFYHERVVSEVYVDWTCVPPF